MYPQGKFSRQAVYNLWHKLDERNWKRNEDPLESAKLLLAELAWDESSLHRPQRIPLSTSLDGFQALAWALPSMLSQWVGRIREIGMDSACELFFNCRIFTFIFTLHRGNQWFPL